MHIIPVKEIQSNVPSIILLHPEDFSEVQQQWQLQNPPKIDDQTQPLLLTDAKGNLFLLSFVQPNSDTEALRNAIYEGIQWAEKYRYSSIQLLCYIKGTKEKDPQLLGRALGEVPILSTYRFLKYCTKQEPSAIEKVFIWTANSINATYIEEGVKIARAVCITRDLVNEPPNVLSARELANRAQEYGRQYGFSVEVFDKATIMALGMGGLLAVNRGSEEPPRFTILEWKPENSINKQPIVLVGKGLIFDTGGLSLKPTKGAMDAMKCDMAGAAAVLGTFIAAASLNLPYHLIGLMPSTDNRPGRNAYTPNDIITMYDGTKVEVRNSDAEGRMILADALAYAKQYNPQLVINMATLTGSAIIAVGYHAIAMYSTADEETTQKLIQSGFRTFERVVHLPLWEDYAELLKSDIADIANVSEVRAAGSIIAAKFLQHFVDYPWIHLDIAGPAYLPSARTYRPKYATGVGVRLLIDFIAQLS